jgi:hypothetical protein
MTEFIITEDFPKNLVEFDRRFSTEKACYLYLFKMRWPNGFSCELNPPPLAVDPERFYRFGEK